MKFRMWGFYFWLTDVINVCPLLVINVVLKNCEDNRNRSKGENLCLELDTYSTWFNHKFWKQIAAFLCWDDWKSVADASHIPGNRTFPGMTSLGSETVPHVPDCKCQAWAGWWLLCCVLLSCHQCEMNKNVLALPVVLISWAVLWFLGFFLPF